MDVAIPWPLIAVVGTPLLGGLWALTLHTRRVLGDLRVELADYRTHVAERYVTLVAVKALERELSRRLERIEDKLDVQAKAVGVALAGGIED